MANVSVNEDAGTMQFTLALSHGVQQEVTYSSNSSTVGGTAIRGVDYTNFIAVGNTTITVPARQTSSTFDIAILDDDIDELDETITIEWRHGAGLTATTPINVTGTITDDDTRGVTQSATSLSVVEGSSTTYTLVLDSEPTES